MVPDDRWGHTTGIKFYKGINKNIFQNLLLKNYQGRKSQIKKEASSGSVDLSLFKSRSPGVGWGNNREIKFYNGIYREHLSKSSPQKTIRQENLKLKWNHPQVV